MSKRDKLHRKIRNNPKGIHFTELETLLLRFGFKLVRVSGSHHVFEYKNEMTEGILVIPVHGASVKTPYVKDAIVLLDKLFPELDEEEKDNTDE